NAVKGRGAAGRGTGAQRPRAPGTGHRAAGTRALTIHTTAVRAPPACHPGVARGAAEPATGRALRPAVQRSGSAYAPGRARRAGDRPGAPVPGRTVFTRRPPLAGHGCRTSPRWTFGSVRSFPGSARCLLGPHTGSGATTVATP